MGHQLVVQKEWNGIIPLEENEIDRLYQHVMSRLSIPSSEVTLRFTDDIEIRALNATYRDKDKATNVLSFELEPFEALQLDLWGDIVISMDTVQRESLALEKSEHKHIAHLFIHGCLHLAGYDHEYDSEAEEMEALEGALLTELGYDNPYGY